MQCLEHSGANEHESMKFVSFNLYAPTHGFATCSHSCLDLVAVVCVVRAVLHSMLYWQHAAHYSGLCMPFVGSAVGCVCAQLGCAQVCVLSRHVVPSLLHFNLRVGGIGTCGYVL